MCSCSAWMTSLFSRTSTYAPTCNPHLFSHVLQRRKTLAPSSRHGDDHPNRYIVIVQFPNGMVFLLNAPVPVAVLKLVSMLLRQDAVVCA